MPYSDPTAYAQVLEMIERNEIEPTTIIDVGAGSGTYSKLEEILPDATFIAVEIWAPYIEQFNLLSQYHEVVVADALRLNWSSFSYTDTLVVLGDVAEHLVKEDALELWDIGRNHQWVIMSLPIIDYPQGPVEGNPYESHLTQWTHEEVLEFFPGIRDHIKGPICGTYLG